jgi:hypothetical protein
VVVRSIFIGTGGLNGEPQMTAPSSLGVDASYPAVAANTEGAIVAWTEQAGGSEIRVQRVR